MASTTGGVHDMYDQGDKANQEGNRDGVTEIT